MVRSGAALALWDSTRSSAETAGQTWEDRMHSRSFAAICGALSLLGIVGCGSSSSSSSSASSTATVSAKALCPSVLASELRYQAARARMSIQFTDKAVEVPTRKAAEELVGKVQELFPAIQTAEQKRQLATFAAALTNQVSLLRAFERHNEAEISRYGNVPSAPLRQGLIDLRTICAEAR
jgi:hypothetical protein